MWPRPLPLPACGEWSEFARSSRKFRVRGPLRESEPMSEPVERPPHPHPLPPSGEREQRRWTMCDSHGLRGSIGWGKAGGTPAVPAGEAATFRIAIATTASRAFALAGGLLIAALIALPLVGSRSLMQ